MREVERRSSRQWHQASAKDPCENLSINPKVLAKSSWGSRDRGSFTEVSPQFLTFVFAILQYFIHGSVFSSPPPLCFRVCAFSASPRRESWLWLAIYMNRNHSYTGILLYQWHQRPQNYKKHFPLVFSFKHPNPILNKALLSDVSKQAIIFDRPLTPANRRTSQQVQITRTPQMSSK